MIKTFFTGKSRKPIIGLLVAALVVGGISAQATGVLNTPSSGYLLCINSKTKVITYPGTSTCPKGSTKLTIGASGKDGKTLWNGEKDPENTLGSPGDMFINSVTKTLFGPKDLTTGWPAGVSMVGPSGPVGASGTAGANATIAITELFVCDGPDAGTVADEKCKIGMTGPGGGLIFFVDYNDQYEGLNYLEAAPTDGVFAASAATGVWATTVAACGTASNASCQSNSIYTQTGVDLTTIKGLHRGLFGGQAATNAIIAKHSGVALNLFAAGVADSYTAATFNGVSKSDYYLPTKDETELMQKNLNDIGVGGFAGDFYYWSSSEYVAGNTWSQYFYGGLQNATGKNSTNCVRPVRAF